MTTLPAVKRAITDPPVARTPTVEQGDDWRTALVSAATQAGSRLTVAERSRNPMMPNNPLDVSNAGLPADLVVLAVQIPRPGVPAEMAQYRDMINLQWLHLPWSAVSALGGEDGKAHIPGASPVDLGGQLVTSLAGNYLMYANRKQFVDRRVRNARKADESLQGKVETRQEESRELEGKRIGTRVESSDPGPMTIDELMAYEKRIGDEAPVRGARIER